ncbi:hypothetical protein Tco_0681612 [Tanacetum coccineum]|uniref:Uncharacterized protein n=1 Tax=Tanacetum coccineum TaxID=301880 RepID=A0ABQ4XNU0_9ASTR
MVDMGSIYSNKGEKGLLPIMVIDASGGWWSKIGMKDTRVGRRRNLESIVWTCLKAAMAVFDLEEVMMRLILAKKRRYYM